MLICNAFDRVRFYSNNEMSHLAAPIPITWTLVAFLLYFLLTEGQLILAHCKVNLGQVFQ